MIAAAVTTAGIGLLKRAASNPTIACVCQKPLAQSHGTFNEFFGEKRSDSPGFTATMEDKSVPTTIPHLQKDVQWLPQEWQEWGKFAVAAAAAAPPPPPPPRVSGFANPVPSLLLLTGKEQEQKLKQRCIPRPFCLLALLSPILLFLQNHSICLRAQC
eukprot:1947671-Rhodomonas_salina.1